MKKAFFVILVGLVLLPVFSVMSSLLQTGENQRPVWVHVEKGQGASSIATQLASGEVVRSAFEFKILSHLFFMQDKLQAGSYKFKARPKMVDVLLKLKRGETSPPDPLKVSFPEGTSIYKMADILKDNDVECSEEFRKLTKTDLAERLSVKFPFLKGIRTRSLEGYLYPDTYIFDKNVELELLVQLMLLRFKDLILPYWEANQGKTRFDLHEALTLASIIEKEAASGQERPVVSSVFHNRMGLGMRLDSCATIKYALDRPTKTVYLEQLDVKSPYNTYINKGLPPGPICNPGLSSFKAAIEPADTDYCYFVSRRDGTHVFSKTGKEHLRAKSLIEKGQLLPLDR